MRPSISLAASAAVFLVNVLPISANDHHQTVFSSSSAQSPHAHKIAIIGSGPSGSSAAYWLSKAQGQLEFLGRGSEGFDIHLYEKEDRIGGRVKVTYPFGDEKKYEAVELGASIFADVNRNMQRAAKEFDLPTGAHLGEEGSITAVWDGSQFIIDDLGESWWSSAKLFWRYGYSPVTTRSLVNDLKNKFLQLYDSKWLHSRKNHNETTSGFPWKSIEQMASKLDFNDALGTTAQTWFYGKGVSQLFIQELIEAATRVNYGQNTDSIHALGGGVSLAASGATGVRGGNFRIFEEMIMRSNARVHFGEQGEVTGIVKFKSMAEAFAAGKIPAEEYEVASQSTAASSPKWWIGTAAGTGGLYDAVLIGAPWHTSGITLVNTESVIPVNPYVHLYVTVLATNASHPNPVYFGRTKGSDVPTTILTSYEAVRKQNKQQQGKTTGSKAQRRSWWQLWTTKTSNAAKQVQLEFTSLSYMSKLPSRPESNAPEHLVKIFSLSHLSDDQLDEIMGPNTTSWIHRQEWDAYPELLPTSEFPAIQPDEGLYYINALEMMISTMETSTVASRNVVAGLLEKWYGLDFVVGGKECEFSEQDGADRRPGWDGWGCNAA